MKFKSISDIKNPCEYNEFFIKRLIKRLEKYNGKNIGIYGTGGYAIKLLEKLNFDDLGVKLVGIADRDGGSVGKNICGYVVCEVKELVNKIDCIIIASDLYQEVVYNRIESLMKDNNVDIIKIFDKLWTLDPVFVEDYNSRKIYLDELPEKMSIEMTLGCNLKCLMCPHSVEASTERKFAFMDMETFDEILDKISDRQRVIDFNILGEPLINPNILEFVRKAKERGHYIWFATNATKLNKEMADALLELNLDHIEISIDGFKKETYEGIRIGSNLDLVMKNVEYLCEINREKRQKYGYEKSIVIALDYIISEKTEDEVYDFIEYWKQKSDILNFRFIHDWNDQVDYSKTLGRKLALPKGMNKNVCDVLWKELDISAEGDVVICCYDFKKHTKLSNLKEKNLKDIWKYEIGEYRKQHINGSFTQDICINCDNRINGRQMY